MISAVSPELSTDYSPLKVWSWFIDRRLIYCSSGAFGKRRGNYSGSNSVIYCFEFLTGFVKIQEDCSGMTVQCFLYDFHDFYGISYQAQNSMLANLPLIHASFLETVLLCIGVWTNCFVWSSALLVIPSESSSSTTCPSVNHSLHKSVCLVSCVVLKPLANLEQWVFLVFFHQYCSLSNW